MLEPFDERKLHLDVGKLVHVLRIHIYNMFRIPLLLAFFGISLIIAVVQMNYLAISVDAAFVIVFIALECRFGDLLHFKRKHSNTIKYLKNMPLYVPKEKPVKIIEEPIRREETEEDKLEINYSGGEQYFLWKIESFEQNSRLQYLRDYYHDKVYACDYHRIIRSDNKAFQPGRKYLGGKMAVICQEIANDSELANATNDQLRIAVENKYKTTPYSYPSEQKKPTAEDIAKNEELNRQLNGEIQKASDELATEWRKEVDCPYDN